MRSSSPLSSLQQTPSRPVSCLAHFEGNGVGTEGAKLLSRDHTGGLLSEELMSRGGRGTDAPLDVGGVLEVMGISNSGWNVGRAWGCG